MKKPKVVKDYPDYTVGVDGEILSFKYGKRRKLAPVRTQCGYLRVKLSASRKSVPHLIHRLVAMAFVPNPRNKPDVNHKNGVKTDNRMENLEWVTRAENIKHAMKNGLHSNPEMPVVCLEANKVFNSQAEAAQVLGISQGNIARVIAGERTHAGGFTFRRVS